MSRAEWKPDAECPACELCSTPFGLFRRRHHCRRCGGVFCDKCCSDKWKGLSGYSHDDPQRVCKDCKFALEAILEVGNMRPRERKVCVVGCPQVGKTSLLLHMCASTVGADDPPGGKGSGGSAFNAVRTKPIPFRGSEYVLHFVDVAAQGTYDVFQPQLTIGAHAYVFVYDVMDRGSFLGLSTIRDDILRCGGRQRVTFIVGNRKCVAAEESPLPSTVSHQSGVAAGLGQLAAMSANLITSPLVQYGHQAVGVVGGTGLVNDRQVTSEEAQNLAVKWGARYVELSAKRQRSADDLVSSIVKTVAEWDER